MKHLLCIVLVIATFSQPLANNVKDDLKIIDTYLSHNLDSAILLSEGLLKKSERERDYFGTVKANLYLGYLQYEKGQYTKSVVYYLEGIRQSQNANYDGVEVDKIWLRRNLANTFRRYEANGLATKYNLEAIEIAVKINNIDQIVTLKFNQALVYQKNKQFTEASQFLLEILPLISDQDYKSEILNQIGLIYHEGEDPLKAMDYFHQVLSIPRTSEQVKLYSAKSLHNLGEVHYESGEVTEAISNLRESIAIMESLNENQEYSLFLSYRNLGRYLFEVGDIENSKKFLNKAEVISSFAEWDASSFEIYKTLSNLYYKIGDSNLGKEYSEIYFNKIQKYLETQEEIQKKDKEYNFDLITKRYFDEVEKQEQIASILFISKLTSGGLLALLLMVIGYNRYEKFKLRRSIEKELVALRLIN